MHGEASQLTAWIALLLIGAGVILFLVVSRRFAKNRQKGQETLQSIGFIPVSADTALEERFRHLYRNPYAFLRELYQRKIPDGMMFIFGLDNPDGVLTQRGIAILSSNLSLPSFRIFPKIAPQQFGLGQLANQIIERAVSTVDDKVELPEFPEFDKKYLLYSGDRESVRQFFSNRMADYFSGTQLYSILAEGDWFVFEDYGMLFVKNDLSTISQSVSRAMEIYKVFQTK